MKTRLFIFVAVFGIAAIAIGWVYESNLSPKQEKKQSTIPDDIDYFLTNMTYRMLNAEGELDFQLHSPRLEHYPHNDVSSIELPSMQVYTEADPWQIDALSGEIEHGDETLRLRDKVVMQKSGARPMQVFTDDILFEPNRNLVTAKTDILMLDHEARIEAEQAQFDLSGKVYKFSNARTVYHREDS